MGISVSVIVPVYNMMKCLERCVDSVLNQTFQDFELILVDDGSCDGSGELCDRWAAKYANVKVIHQENRGLGYARNSGIDRAVGKYIVFVDADDYLGRDYLYHLQEAADQNNADCAVAGYTVVYPNQRMHRQPCVKKDRLFRGEEIRELLLGSFGALPGSRRDVPYGQAVWARIYKRQVIADHSVRFVSERKYISEDIIFNLDFLRHAVCAVAVPDISYHYNCTNADSLSKIHRSDRVRMDIRLKRCMERKLNEIFENREYVLYLQRFLIMRVAFDLVQEVLYHDRRDRSYPLKGSVRAILSNDELQRVLRAYPWWRLPFQRRILAGVMRFQMADLLILSIRIRQRFANDRVEL